MSGAGGNGGGFEGGVSGSQLDRMIARLTTQRACLEQAARLIADVPGPVLEFGLGKGRTYDHLRRLFPEREIFAFDRKLHAPAECTPAPEHLILGELRDTLRAGRERIGALAALAHLDVGTSDPRADELLVQELGPLIEGLVRPRGIVLSDRPMQAPRLTPLPRSVTTPWPYYLYRMQAARY